MLALIRTLDYENGYSADSGRAHEILTLPETIRNDLSLEEQISNLR